MCAAINERARRKAQRDEERLANDQQLARTALVADAPVEIAAQFSAQSPTERTNTGKGASPPESTSAEGSPQKSKKRQNGAEQETQERIRDPYAGIDIQVSPEVLAHTKKQLTEYASSLRSPVSIEVVNGLLGYLDQGKYIFAANNLRADFGVSPKIASELMKQLKENGFLTRLEDCMARPYPYRFRFSEDFLTETDYASEMLERLHALRRTSDAARESRIANIIFDCLPKGYLSYDDYAQRENSQQVWYKDRAYAEQMGLVERVDASTLRIRRTLPPQPPCLNRIQKNVISAVFENFGALQFSKEMAVASVHYAEGRTCACLRELTILHIIRKEKGEDGNLYQLLVTPEQHPGPRSYNGVN